MYLHAPSRVISVGSIFKTKGHSLPYLQCHWWQGWKDLDLWSSPWEKPSCVLLVTDRLHHLERLPSHLSSRLCSELCAASFLPRAATISTLKFNHVQTQQGTWDAAAWTWYNRRGCHPCFTSSGSNPHASEPILFSVPLVTVLLGRTPAEMSQMSCCIIIFLYAQRVLAGAPCVLEWNRKEGELAHKNCFFTLAEFYGVFKLPTQWTEFPRLKVFKQTAFIIAQTRAKCERQFLVWWLGSCKALPEANYVPEKASPLQAASKSQSSLSQHSSGPLPYLSKRSAQDTHDFLQPMGEHRIKLCWGLLGGPIRW